MKDSTTARAVLYNGTHGNTAQAVLKAVLAAEAADTEINMGVLPAGAQVTAMRVDHDNLGAGTSVKIGYQYVDPDMGAVSEAYFGTHATTAVGSKQSTAKPIRFEGPVHIIAKVTGAPATGEVFVTPTYINHGVK